MLNYFSPISFSSLSLQNDFKFNDKQKERKKVLNEIELIQILLLLPFQFILILQISKIKMNS
jgi:hypothetical protein